MPRRADLGAVQPQLSDGTLAMGCPTAVGSEVALAGCRRAGWGLRRWWPYQAVGGFAVCGPLEDPGLLSVL